MKKLLAKFDDLLRSSLRLKKTKLPMQMIEKDKKIGVLSFESAKRHAHVIPVDKINLELIDEINKEKLGAAIGKMMADQLVISFDEIVIKEEKPHAS